MKKTTDHGPRTHPHFNSPRLRIDTWSVLKTLAHELDKEKDNSKSVKKIKENIIEKLNLLNLIEIYHAFPGPSLTEKIKCLFFKNETALFIEIISLIDEALSRRRSNYKALLKILKQDNIDQNQFLANIDSEIPHYFEVLLIGDLTAIEEKTIKSKMDDYSNIKEEFVYEVVVVNNLDDAIIAIMLNFNIKCCLITDNFLENKISSFPFKMFYEIEKNYKENNIKNKAVFLSNLIKKLRPELDIYYIASAYPEITAAHHDFDKIFYEFENHFELHLSIIKGIHNRFATPFFDSLKKYSLEPKTTFHALPIARGKSIFNSRWLCDMEDFYGKNIFLAESSSTAGGLDSLMNPIGSIKKAMERAAICFGANETFFVTNGTSASNKIVLQALLKPGDIVLIDHSCHKSHHNGIILTGAYPIYLEGYHLKNYDIIGPVPLKHIKKQLLDLKKENLLEKVKLMVLTNCTFDGLTYNIEKYMEEILSICPHIIFLIDEAWFAFARAVPHYRTRTAMYAAQILEKKLGKIRVYATQSTHKSLSCFRQGSMIHVYDTDFKSVRENFTHAFNTHSTTSPNYQIIATLDLARRQLELEGYQLVQYSIELAMIFRTQVNQHELISHYFHALGPAELIPDEFRQSGIQSGYDSSSWLTIEKAWLMDDVVIDPTRVSLQIKTNKYNGYQIRRILIDKYGIQINKVSINSILFQFNIGTLRSSVSFLMDALFEICLEINKNEGVLSARNASSPPEIPGFSYFHPFFTAYNHSKGMIGDIRKAYYMSLDENFCECILIPDLIKRIQKGETFVSATILTPEPPGYPILLPGQLISRAILELLLLVDPDLIIGPCIENGINVFKQGALPTKRK